MEASERYGQSDMKIEWIVAVVVIFLPLAGLIAFLLSPSQRIGIWMHQAKNARLSRDHKRAEFYYRKLSEVSAKLRDPDQRAAIQFVSEQGLGVCMLQQDHFATAEDHLHRAIELWQGGVECERGLIAYTLAELTVAQSAQGKTGLADQTLNRLRELCDELEESERQEAADFLIAAANGASARNNNELAFQLAALAALAQSVLEGTAAWREGAMAHTQISLASFHLMHCEYGPARELIETAIASAGEELDREDTDNAYFNLGWISFLSGDLNAAKRAFERSRRIRAEESGESHWYTSLTISALADVHRASGEYELAKQYSGTAWEIQSAQLQEDDAIKAGTAMSRGLLLIDLGSFQDADQILAEAFHVAQGKGRLPLRASLRLAQGLSRLTRGHHQRADELLREALAISEDAYGVGHRMTLDCRAILGSNWIQLGRYDEAESLLNETLAIRETLSDVSLIDLADLLCIRAELYFERGEPAAAESTALRAQSLIENRVAGTHLIHAEIGETLGRVQHTSSEFMAALEHFDKALKVRENVQPVDHPRLVKLLEAQAMSLTAIGQGKKADAQRKRAKHIRNSFPDPD